MAFEKTQNKLDELRNLTWQNGKLVELLSQLSVNGLETELQQGKSNIVGAIKSKGVDASIDESMTSLADKITKIKEVEVITLPAETSNEFANTFFNTMMQSQGYDKIYETVYANYCGEEGYVGALMTVLDKASNTSIVLTGADAYYIYEEDKFYTTDEEGNLITVLDGISTNLYTQSHLWDANNLSIQKTVFYLYKEGSTADGEKEIIHKSAFDYCRDSNIPNIRFSHNSGYIMHYHLSNPDTCILGRSSKYTNTNQMCVYYYTNVENLTKNNTIYNGEKQNALQFINFNQLQRIYLTTSNNTTVSFLYKSFIQNLNLPHLKTIEGCTLCNECNNIKNLNLPNLEVIEGKVPSRIIYSTNNNFIYNININKLKRVDLAGSVSGSVNYSLISCNCNKLHLPNLETFVLTYQYQSLLRGNCKELYLPTLKKTSSPITTYNHTLLELNLPELEEIGQCICSDCNSITKITAPKLKKQYWYTNESSIINNLPELEECLMPELEYTKTYSAPPYAYYQLPKLKHISFKSTSIPTHSFRDGTTVNLIWIELTDNPNNSFGLGYWNPTNALSSESNSLVDEGEEFTNNLEKFKYKFQTSIAEKLTDRTGTSALTITLNSNVINALTDEIKQIITNKNWNIASL